MVYSICCVWFVYKSQVNRLIKTKKLVLSKCLAWVVEGIGNIDTMSLIDLPYRDHPFDIHWLSGSPIIESWADTIIESKSQLRIVSAELPNSPPTL